MNLDQIQSLRESYLNPKLNQKDLDSDPISQFNRWFTEAMENKIIEPNAMTLSTTDNKGIPDSRTVLYKGMTAQNNLTFYTNYQSKKGQDIEVNPHVALLFNWLSMTRQIRIQGIASKMSKEASASYFYQRPRGSQIGAWISNQSKTINTRSELEEKWGEFENRFKDRKIPLPPHWGGYKVTPKRFEFWQGNENRLHDRFIYIFNEGWKISRLAP